MSTVIKVENLSKQYRLGDVGTGSMAHDINRAWHKLRGKEDPYLKIGESNDRTTKGNSEYVWALKDINFEVKQGEVLGIIGRNGAGKSTLLKILSRTTTPTTGSVKIKGRVASLLEVGTGFHPELSGRENIFLNGAIMGMTKHEIKRKFDEIVDFAGVERYIDTPVKRYSSGMYVRLAFGVAAHLEPEILIVDEVLAVGDAEFQKKALGKMKDVSEKEGRTVLFVSHNMAAIQSLCNRAVLLSDGRTEFTGSIKETIGRYLAANDKSSTLANLNEITKRTGNAKVSFYKFHIENSNNQIVKTVLTGDDVTLVFKLSILESSSKKIDIGFSLHNTYDEMQSYLYSAFQDTYYCATEEKYLTIKCCISNFPFTNGPLLIRGRVIVDGIEADWPAENIGSIEIESGDFYKNGKIIKNIAPFLIKGIWE